MRRFFSICGGHHAGGKKRGDKNLTKDTPPKTPLRLERSLECKTQQTRSSFVGDGPNTVSESTVSNTELSECFFCGHLVPGRELSEFISAYYLCAKANSPSLSQNSTSFAPKLSEISLPKQYSRNSIRPVSYFGGTRNNS